MSETLRVLQVEDSESDAGLILRRLELAGYDVHSQRVEAPDTMRDALALDEWDIVIADHHMARFDAPGALRILHESGRDIPFIVVSGSIGEELAVAMMKSGAHDYVLKDRLARLVPAVERELREAISRRHRHRVEQDLAESRERLSLAIEATQLGTFDHFPPTGKVVASELLLRHFGLPPHAGFTMDAFLRAVHPDDRERISTVS
jgi:DNA-binding NtrC family response regulator